MDLFFVSVPTDLQINPGGDGSPLGSQSGQLGLDHMQLSPNGLTNGQTLAARMRKLLGDIMHETPGLDINPYAYGMHSLCRGWWLHGQQVLTLRRSGAIVDGNLMPSGHT